MLGNKTCFITTAVSLMIIYSYSHLAYSFYTTKTGSSHPEILS